MTITIYSVFMTIVWISLFSVLIYYLLQKDKFLYSFNVWPILLILVASIIRVSAVIEFPGTKIIHESEFFPVVRDFLYFKLFDVLNVKITVLVVLLVVWGVGSVVRFIHFIYSYWKFCSSISRIAPTDDELVIKVAKEVCSSRKRIRLIKSKSIDVPTITGYFRLTILLPDMKMSEQELRYAMLHEWNHYKHGDLWIKLIVNVICSVWWWNPLVRFLKKNLDHALEMRCDMYATESLTGDEFSDYFKTIIAVCRHSNEKNGAKSDNVFTAGFVSTQDEEKLLIQRVNVGLEYKPRKYNFLINAAMCVAIIGTLVLSYSFIIQPAGYPEDNPDMYSNETDGEIFITTSESSYLVDNGDGTYSVYFDDVYVYDIAEVSINIEPFSELEIKDGNAK